MPTPRFSTCQGGVRANPHNEGGMQHHPPSRLPAAPRTVKAAPAPHSCSWQDQRESPGRCLTLNPSTRKGNAMISVSQEGN